MNRQSPGQRGGKGVLTKQLWCKAPTERTLGEEKGCRRRCWGRWVVSQATPENSAWKASELKRKGVSRYTFWRRLLQEPLEIQTGTELRAGKKKIRVAVGEIRKETMSQSRRELMITWARGVRWEVQESSPEVSSSKHTTRVLTFPTKPRTPGIRTTLPHEASGLTTLHSVHH